MKYKKGDLLLERKSYDCYQVSHIEGYMRSTVVLMEPYGGPCIKLKAFLVSLYYWNLNSDEDVVDLLSMRLKEDLMDNYGENL